MAISAEKISFAYSNKKVLNNFSISLNTNDFTMLLGPNGSGKSTVIKLLLGPNGSGKSTVIKLLGGFLPAEHGKILLDGLEIAKIPAFERARKIAVVSQIMPPVLNYTVQQIEGHLITRNSEGFTGPRGPRIRGRSTRMAA